MTPLQEALANAVRELQRTHDAYIKARDAVQTLLGQTPQQGPGKGNGISDGIRWRN